MKVVAVIPARFGSTRLPGKPLLKIDGREMILHVADRVKASDVVEEIFVATDDPRIAEVAENGGIPVVMTRLDHASGTDRIAEAALKIEADILVNVQGDEPILPADVIDRAVEPFFEDDALLMGSVKTKLFDHDQLFDPNCVKVVVDQNDFALYFSRSPIPFVRDGMDLASLRLNAEGREFGAFFKHIGIYVFRKDFLLRFASMKPGRLEVAERLEQLRALEAGVRIKVPTVNEDTISVDTPEDLDRVRAVMEESSGRGKTES